MLPQLAHPTDHSTAIRHCADDGWYAEQKLDGERLLIEIEGEALRAIRRNGNVKELRDITRLSSRIEEAFEPFEGDWVFDGEVMGDGVYWIFDMPVAMGQIQTTDPYSLRRDVLEQFFPTAFSAFEDCIRLLPSAKTSQQKIDLARSIVKSHGEGVMLKRANGIYLPGRRVRTTLKWKFTKTADCIVSEVRPPCPHDCPRRKDAKHLAENSHRSVNVQLLDPETHELIDVGAVAMSDDNLQKVRRGDVIEVRYLYVENPAKPRLYQPAFMRMRPDKSANECWITQLEYTLTKSVVETP